LDPVFPGVGDEMRFFILALKTLAVLFGALLGAYCFGMLGMYCEINGNVGAFWSNVGAVVGAFVAFAAVTKLISRIITGAISSAVLFALVGAVIFRVNGDGEWMHEQIYISALLGATIGAILGYFGWPWIYGIFGAFIGLHVGLSLQPRGNPRGLQSISDCIYGGITSVLVWYFLKLIWLVPLHPKQTKQRKEELAKSR
jgi:hypothetical protein